MSIYSITHPERAKPIGKMHTTMVEARKAALRAARRLGHATIKHWRYGRVETHFADGTSVTYLNDAHDRIMT